jgi:hypothetical protein
VIALKITGVSLRPAHLVLEFAHYSQQYIRKSAAMPYMVEHGGTVIGPFTLEELNQRVRSNEIATTDLACDQQVGHWLPVSSLLTNKPAPIPAAPQSSDPLLASRNSSSLFGRGTFAGVGGALLALLFFLWRAFRILNMLARLHRTH